MFDIVLEPALCVLRKRTYCSGEHFVSSVTFSLDIVVVDEVIKVVISVVAATCVVVVSFAVIVVLVDGFVDVFPLASSVLISKKEKKSREYNKHNSQMLYYWFVEYRNSASQHITNVTSSPLM